MSSPFTCEMVFPLRASPRVRWIAGALHLFVLVVAAGVGRGQLWSVAPLVLIAASAWLTDRELTVLPRHYPVVRYKRQDGWRLETRDGAAVSAAVAGAPVVWVSVVLVPLGIAGRRYTLVLAVDTVPAAILRRLRVNLRTAPGARDQVFAGG